MGKLATILVPVLAVALAATGYWGYRENQEKNSILIKAENQYQQSFHNLTYYMDSLHKELGKSVAMNSRRQLSPCLTNVWRLSYAAQNSVGQLPLTLMPFHQTEAFLSKIGDFSFRTATRDLDQKPLSTAEYHMLKNLYTRSGEIVSQLRKVESAIYEKRLRWMDVEQAIASEDKQMDNAIIDGFKLINQRVDGYREIQFGNQSTSGEEVKIKKLTAVKGPAITPEEAKKRALTFSGVKNPKEVKVTSIDKKGIYPTYDVSILHADGKTTTLVELLRNGGALLWMMNTRSISNEKISVENAEVKAYRFLLSHGFEGMENTKTEKYDHVAVFTYVPRQEDVLLYSDAVSVKVALDRGEVVGVQAENYVANHRPRTMQKPKLSLALAKKRLNPGLKIEQTALALIQNEEKQEVLVYEFIGKIDKAAYEIFINANTGDEEKIDHLDYAL